MREIRNIEDLVKINTLKEYAVLKSDIDGDKYGSISEPVIDCIKEGGVLDGNGYEIKNINPITHINNGEIRDFAINSLNTQSDSDYTGGVVEINAGLIENIEADLFVVDGISGVGGIAGFNVGTIRDVKFSGILHGEYDVGGIVGFNDGTVVECYSFGVIDGQLNVGELVGNNNIESTVMGSSDCCVIDSDPDQKRGGLIGLDFENE